MTVGRIGNESKRLAVSLNIPFILLSQLNRKSEDLSEPEPIMSDLSGTFNSDEKFEWKE